MVRKNQALSVPMNQKVSKKRQFPDDPVMAPVHQIREELYQQFKKSGLTYLEWLKATEQELTESLAEIGFKIVTEDGFQYLVEI
jgi:hypothetical protein